MKVLDTKWFCGSSNTGIVRVQTDEGIKYFIGFPPIIRAEHEDAQWIADWGCSFPKDAGDVLFGIEAHRVI